MTVVAFRLFMAAQAQNNPGQKKMTMVAVTSGLTLTVPFAPKQVQRGGLAAKYEQLARPGDQDLLIRTNEQTGTLAFDLFLSYGDYATSVEDRLDGLRNLALQQEAIAVHYGPNEIGPWYITDLSWDTTDRVPQTNEISEATAHVTLVHATDYGYGGNRPVGPLTGGINSKTPVDQIPGIPATYTVRAGDTLTSIAMTFFHDPAWAGYIAIVNGWRDQTVNLKPGTVIRLR